MKKAIIVPNEIAWLFATALLSLAVAMAAAADFGVSMVVAPAYLLSLKVSFLTFGQSEYVLQAALFIVFCLLMKRIKWTYFASFGTCLVYGAMLDGWRAIIPILNPAITPSGSMALWIRLVFFVLSIWMTGFSIAVFFHTYFPPQVYDFFVKGISGHFHKDRTKFKFIYDATSLVVACVMTLCFFGEFRGVWFGTLVITLCNSWIIGLFSRWMDRRFVFRSLFPKWEKAFALE